MVLGTECVLRILWEGGTGLCFLTSPVPTGGTSEVRLMPEAQVTQTDSVVVETPRCLKAPVGILTLVSG